MTNSLKLFSKLDGQTPCQRQCLLSSLDMVALVPYAWLSSSAEVWGEVSLFTRKYERVYLVAFCVQCLKEAADLRCKCCFIFLQMCSKAWCGPNHWIYCMHEKLSSHVL